VIRAEFPGLSSMGSAYLAGIGTGLWTKEQIRSLNGSKQAFVPLMDSRLSRKYYDEWKRNISLMVEASDKTLPVNAIPK
jgi:glycerol kinase